MITSDIPANKTNTDNVYDLMLEIVLSMQVSLAALGFLVNCTLLIGLLKTSHWPFYQRLLFTNVTTAATISCLMHCAQGSVQLHQLASGGEGTLEGSIGSSDQVADTAQTTVAVSMAALAFQNYYALYQCDKQITRKTSEKTSKKMKIVFVSLMIISVWLIAGGFVAGDLNPQAQIYKGDEKSNASAYISFAIGLTIEFSVMCTIYATRRMLRKLQIDFEVHRAQQSLDARLHIKETISLTAAISRVLLAHILVWVTTIATGFGVNRYLKVNADASDIDYQMSAFTSVVDVMVMSFDVAYPFVVMRKQPQLQRHMGLSTLIGRCETLCQQQPLREVVVQTSIDSNNARNPAALSGHAHFDVVGDLWDRVANIKFTKLPASNRVMPANLSIPSINAKLETPKNTWVS